MSFWTVDNLRHVVNGRWLRRGDVGADGRTLNGVNTDTRTIAPGHVFVALRGERFDAHQFLDRAIAGGAGLAVIDDPSAAASVNGACPILQVDDTLTALHRLAAAYRRTLRARVIAVTGSNGKTTTKHLIHTVLSARHTGKASPKSFNNHVGVPLTILAADPADHYLVVEVGTNAPGEIAALGRIVQPDVAVITSVAPVHLEGLGDVAAVLREKASLLSHLRDGGVAVINADVPGLIDHARVAPAVLTYGSGASCDLRLTNVRLNAGGTSRIQVNGRWELDLPLLGRHNAHNALAACAVARTMHLNESTIAAALANASSPDMRLQLSRIDTPGGEPVTIINDAYNANPASMAAAVDTLCDYPTQPPGRRIAILGDMAELGGAGPDYHRKLGEHVADSAVDLAVFIGPLSVFAAETLLRRWPPHRVHTLARFTDDNAAQAAGVVRPGDTVLIKASRSAGLERLVPVIEQRLAATGDDARRQPHTQATTP